MENRIDGMKMGMSHVCIFAAYPKNIKLQGTQPEAYSLKNNDSAHIIQNSSINLKCD